MAVLGFLLPKMISSTDDLQVIIGLLIFVSLIYIAVYWACFNLWKLKKKKKDKEE